MQRVVRLLAAALIIAGCAKHEPAAPPSSAAPPPTAVPAVPAVEAAPAAAGSALPRGPTAAGDDLLSLASGVMVVAGPGGIEPTAREWAMLDEDPASGWIREEDKAIATPIVLELPARVRIDALVLDEGKCDLASRLVHELDVEISDQSATTGFHRIAHIPPTRVEDGIGLSVAPGATGRWLRIVSLPRKNPDEGVAEIQIMNLHAYGERLAPTPMPQVTGTYDTDIGTLHLSQKGAEVTGCADKATRPLAGVLEGRVLRLQWEHDAQNDHGPMVLVFGDQGRVFGAYWNETVESPPLLTFDPHRTSTAPGACPKPAQDPLGAQLASSGRVRLYGINFDTDKDTLRPESRPTLDRVVALLQGAPALKLRIEGHTDDRGSADHNRALSDARAATVKAYLVAAGIDAARLETQGFGATKPAASNASEIGRAVNRRVELVKL